MNTTKHIPFEAAAPNIVRAEELEDFPGFSGTGFFVVFPPYGYVFYVTARHCLTSDNSSDEIGGCLLIPYVPGTTECVRLSAVLSTNIDNNPDEGREDLLVFVVDQEIDSDKHDVLEKRALRLEHQDEIDKLLGILVAEQGNVRAFGFPTHNHPNCRTFIDYDEPKSEAQPRGFYGIIRQDGLKPNQYLIDQVNWREGDYNGFSGSPVISLHPVVPDGDVLKIPIGIIVTASSNKARFLSINVATNLIAAFLLREVREGNLIPQE